MTPPDLVSALRALLNKWREQIKTMETLIEANAQYHSFIRDLQVAIASHQSCADQLDELLARIATPAQEPTTDDELSRVDRERLVRRPLTAATDKDYQ